jgi:flagellar protein FliO/FliZ
MNFRLYMLAVSLYVLPAAAWAAGASTGSAVVSPSAGLLKMVLGLGLVLALIALVAWLAKRMLPAMGGQHSILRVVSSVSVGSRERVVVVEVGDRWLVVGVAPGQVRPIANMEIGSTLTPNGNAAQMPPHMGALGQALVPPFAQWLKKSAAKFSSNSTKNSDGTTPAEDGRNVK